jgi:intein/homing endonuclease
MAYEILIGRKEKEKAKFGMAGTVFIGKQYVTMGETTSLANNIYMDIAKAHVVFVVGKRGSGKCLEENTLITLSDGSLVPIKYLDSDNRDIFSLNQDLKVQQAAKTDFFKRQVSKLIHLKFRSGKELKLTPEHPLLTVKGWVPAERLNIGSRIATPRKLDVFGDRDVEEHKIKLLAYLITEGHLGNHFVIFSNKDAEIVNDFNNSIFAYDKDLIIKIHSKPGCYRIIPRQRTRKTDFALRDNAGKFCKGSKFVHNNSLRNWLSELGLYGKKSYDKFIPDLIFHLPKNKTALFLNRMFSCDGSIYNTNDCWQISYSSMSQILVRQISSLLLRFEIVSRIRTKNVKCNGKYFRSYELVIGGEFVNNFIQNIGFYGEKEHKQKEALKSCIKLRRNPNVDTIPKEIWDIYRPGNWADIGRSFSYSNPKSLRSSVNYAPSRQKLLQISKLDENELVCKLACSDIFWDEIISLTEIQGSFYVYDLTVPEHHNFVANDVIVHNSYSMGAIAEGLSDMSPEVRQNLSIIMLDTMGVYWTMKYPNEKDAKLLKEWGLEPKGLDVQIFTPVGYYQKYKDEGVPTDFPFAIRPAELSISDWCLSFGIDRNSDMGVLIERIINNIEEKNYSIQDIIYAVEDDKKSDEKVKHAVINRFENAKLWGLFSERGTKLSDLVIGGKVSVLDVSCYATMPGGWAIKSLAIGLIAQKLFVERMKARKDEEFGDIKSKTEYYKEEAVEKKKEPLVWLVVDEAHEFLPHEGKTAATDALVTILREGRQPGISLILASQQPGKIHTDVMTQSDIIMSHRLTAKIDTDALSQLMQSYFRKGLDKYINELPRKPGAGILIDDANERIYMMQVRPRITWHGGEAPIAIPEKKEI